METRLLTGPDLLDRLGPALDDLCAATATPVTARRPWLTTWVRCHVEYEPLALTVQNGRAGLEAAALLGRRRGRGLEEFVALGHGPSDQTRLHARTPEAAEVLASAVTDHLATVGGRWRLTFRHLPCGDAVAQRIAARLKDASLVEGAPSPVLRLGQDRSPRCYVSHNHHQQVKRMLNRMHREGLTPVIDHLRGEAAIRAVLPEVEQVCRQRDLQLRGRSVLERPAMGQFFDQVVVLHATRGEVQLTTVRLGGELAAYVLCFLDHGVYRMWNCRLSPKWSRYGVGRVGNDAALRSALNDLECREFDWMLGEEPYKFSMSNLLRRSQDLLAWSSGGVRVVYDMRRRLRGQVKRAASRHDWLQSALLATKRLQGTGLRSLAALRAVHSHPAPPPGLRVEDTQDLERLAEDWEELAERLEAAPFTRPGWIEAWWKAFGTGRLRILAVRDQLGCLRAVLPLRERLGALSSPTNWHSNEFGPLADRPEAADLLLAAALLRHPRRLALAFLDDGPAERAEALATARGYRVIRRTQASSPYISLEGGWEAYQQGLSRKLRSDLRRRRRLLEQRGRVELEVTCAQRLDTLLAEGFRLEGSGWKSQRGTAILSRPETVLFYSEMARWSAQRDMLRLAFLRLDGRPVAFNLCLERHGVHYLLKSGYDPAFADFGPGKLLRNEMVARAFRIGLKSYEFLGSAEPSKLEWTRTTRPRWLVQGFRPSPLGALDWSAFALARPLVKNLRDRMPRPGATLPRRAPTSPPGNSPAGGLASAGVRDPQCS